MAYDSPWLSHVYVHSRCVVVILGPLITIARERKQRVLNCDSLTTLIHTPTPTANKNESIILIRT